MNIKATRPEPRSSINKIAAYVPGKSVPTGRDPKTGLIYKLSSNESPLGPSPAAIAAISSISHLEDYPDGNSSKLRQAIADVHGLNPERIVCGAGSDELLSLLASAYLGEGDEAIYSEHGFLMYKISILATGATPIVALEKDQTAQVDEILAKVSDKTRVVFLANPNNPTGTYLPFDEVKRLHAGLRDDILLVLDAAYAEYVEKNDYESGVELVTTSENVVMTRTFSKIYGLANLRIGWCFGPAHIMDAINRIRGPFNTNGAALAAAEAAIRDADQVNRSVAHNNKWLELVTSGCEEMGLKVTPSVGNFILIHFPQDEKKNATEADKYLQSQGCILRNVASYGFPSALRMTIGSEDANNAVLTALKEFLSD